MKENKMERFMFISYTIFILTLGIINGIVFASPWEKKDIGPITILLIFDVILLCSLAVIFARRRFYMKTLKWDEENETL